MTATSAINWRDYINPRFELVLLLSAVFEISWTYGYFAIAVLALTQDQTMLSPFVYGGLFLLALYGSRLLLNMRLEKRPQQAGIIALAAASVLLGIRGTLYPQAGLLDLAWLGETVSALGRFFIAFSATGLMALCGMFAWWRGLALSQASFDFESVGFRFRGGVLLISLLALINTWSGRIDMTGMLTTYFMCALLAVALARQEDMGRTDSQVSLPLKGPWLAILAGSGLAVLALGALLGVALSPQGIAMIARWLSPLSPLLFVFLYALLFVAALIVELLFGLISMVLSGLGGRGSPFDGFKPAAPPPFEVLQQSNDLNALAAYLDPLRTACAAGLFIGMLIMLALSLNRLRGRPARTGNEVRESVPVSLDLNPFRRLRDWLRPPSFDFGADNVESIRRIYASLVRLAARRGFPRQDAETPYEFVTDLRAAWAATEAEERLITDAYVRVHYGEHSPTSDEMHQVRAAWERIKAQNQATAKPKT
ncbi:MAG: DUF4129 domain-containing protein [Chloroflexi bacterium]|nr:DUF4129 domain-containing protein [Chloroflexota bacterium]